VQHNFGTLWSQHRRCIVNDDMQSLRSFATNCPASSVLNTSFSGLLSYPLNFIETKVTANESSRLHVCSFPEKGYEFGKSRRCFSSNAPTSNHLGPPCPISNENIKSATDAIDWPTNPSLCKFLQRARGSNDSTPLRLIIFGGSVTAAHDIKGCCCNFALQEAGCPANTTAAACNVGERCRWLTYFLLFFKEYVYPRQVIVEDFSTDATSMPWLFSFALTNPQGDAYDLNITDHDLIILDYSVNDGRGFQGSPKMSNILKDALESVIIELNRRSQPHVDPAVVILEFWPFGHDEFVETYNISTSFRSMDYSWSYRAIAKHYGLPLWSYKEVVWSADLLNNQRQISSYLRFLQNYGDMKKPIYHPPWPIHLFYADLIATMLLTHDAFCLRQSNVSSSANCSQQYKKMPRPLFANSTNMMDSLNIHCKRRRRGASPLLVDEDASQILKSIRVPFSASSPSKFSPSWRLLLDRNRKPGWISPEIDSALNSTVVRLEPKCVALVFPFNREPPVGTNDAILRVQFLRTYKNAGVVDVYVCGQKVCAFSSFVLFSRSPHVPLREASKFGCPLARSRHNAFLLIGKFRRHISFE